MIDKKVRAKIIEVLDSEDAWGHVAMNYIAYVMGFPNGLEVKFRKDGSLSSATNPGRIANRLNAAMDNVMWTNEHPQ